MSVVTNTNPTGSQSQPGGMNAVVIIEPVLARAARILGVDQVEMRRLNAPSGKPPIGPPLANGRRSYATSAFVKETLDRGAQRFEWNDRKARSGQRQGSKVRGIGVAVSPYISGSVGFDGLFVIKPDGRIAIQSGVGSLGTHLVIDVHRVVAEVLDVPWEECEITWGNTGQHLPWTCISGGSQTIHAMTRAAHAAAMDAKAKLQEIAARDVGGQPQGYDVGNERVFRRGGGRSMTLAQTAQRAIELGGKYDGHQPPDDINAVLSGDLAQRGQRPPALQRRRQHRERAWRVDCSRRSPADVRGRRGERRRVALHARGGLSGSPGRSARLISACSRSAAARSRCSADQRPSFTSAGRSPSPTAPRASCRR